MRGNKLIKMQWQYKKLGLQLSKVVLLLQHSMVLAQVKNGSFIVLKKQDELE